MSIFNVALLFYIITSSLGLNLTHYSIVPEATNTSNVSSFEECLCQCFTALNCQSFGYWFKPTWTSPLCQIYTVSEDKPAILDYLLTNYDNQTGLYVLPSSSTSNQCQASLFDSSFNYTTQIGAYNSLTSSRIISVLLMTTVNASRLLAIDGRNSTYFIIDINSLQTIFSNNFFQYGCIPLCAEQYSSTVYIGCTLNIIEVRQFSGNTPYGLQFMYPLSTVGGGAPQSLAILNSDVIYYIIGTGTVYALLTASNTSRLIASFAGFYFNSPAISIVLDSINLALFLASNNGTLFRIQLSSMNLNNATSAVSSGFGQINQYNLPLHVPTSLFLDQCNRVWTLSSPASPSSPQLLGFVLQINSNHTVTQMNTINLTNTLPYFLYAPFNFRFSANYSLYTANADQGVSAYFKS